MWTVSWIFPMVCLIASLWASSLNETFLIKWDFFVGEADLALSLLVDSFSVLFLLTVCLVSTGVLIFSNFYMKDNVFKKKFTVSMVLFILSMGLLVFSSDLFWLMVGWDGLGLSSFFLIIHFQNWQSFNSAMVTFLSNRAGDCFLLLTLSWVLWMSPAWVNSNWSLAVGLMLMFGAFSKSAQVPFSAWLPLAMAAPTPVSALVHSSTLVTAGVFMVLRFGSFFSDVWGLVSAFSFLTILLAGTSSLMEMDLKKVVALSTLSHIGLMILSVSLNMFLGAFIHLILHAFFKSLLFMVSGMIIHQNGNNQDIRKLTLSSLSYPTGVVFLVCLLSMVGAPFLSGFVSKEILFSNFVGTNFGFFYFLASVAFTSMYSIRLLVYLLKTPTIQSTSSPPNPEEWVFALMAFFSICGGILIHGVVVFQFEEFFFFFSEQKVLLFLVLFFGLFAGFFISSLIFFTKASAFFHNMWFVLSLSVFYQTLIFKISWWLMFKGLTKGSMETVIFLSSNLLKTMSLQALYLLLNPLVVVEVVGLSVVSAWVSL